MRANGFGSPSTLGIDSTTTTPGAPAQVFQQRAQVRDDLNHATAQATLNRTFAGDGHDLTVVLTHDETRYAEGDGFTETPALTPPFQDQHIRITVGQTELKADYNQPVGKDGKLKTGYDLTIADDGSDDDTTHGTVPADAVTDPLSRNLYTYRADGERRLRHL